MAANERLAVPLSRLRWILWGVVLLLAIIAVVLYATLRSSGPSSTAVPVSDVPAATWTAGAQRAPDFSLTDQNGAAVSLAALHGRPVVVTFIDPLCRDFCPREASILTEAAAKLGPNAPAIVSVSVDPWADTATNFQADASHWKLGPTWRWGTGTYAELARVWKPYDVGVEVTHKTIAGVKVRYITHTGAAYLIDGKGFERALFLYPFTTDQVVSAAQALDAG
jgi:protein SCO1/2